MIHALLIASAVAISASPDSPEYSANIAVYKEMRSQVGRDADSHVRLALWCEAHGLDAERTKHLTIATLVDPDNAAARGLLGLVRHEGKWLSPDAVARALKDDPDHQAAVKEYLRRRAKTADKPDDQMRLALWCEDNGLRDQATAHFYRVTQLDPSRETAWKHLGYKKEKGRWARPEQLAAEKEMLELQVKANRHWKPILEKARAGLASRHQADRDKARATHDQIRDPLAVPMIWLTFAQGDARRQEAAVRMFGQIDSPGSSRALAMLAISTQSKDVQRSAVEQLKRKDPRDFVGVLIAMIRKPIEYEVRNRVSVDQPGELFIKGADRNWRRIYRAAEMPQFRVQWDDHWMYDAQGNLVLQRTADPTPAGRMAWQNEVAQFMGFNTISGTLNTANPSAITNVLTKGGLPAQQATQLGQTLADNANSPVNRMFTAINLDPLGLYGINPLPRLDIPVGQMMADVERSAREAQAQLEAEVKQIDAYNRPIRDTNRKARQLLNDSTGVDLGEDPEVWQRWFVDMQGMEAVRTSSTREVPTSVEEAPIDFIPSVDPRILQLTLRVSSCFAAGTVVRTIDGLRPIESLAAGDLVLTQDTQTGKMGFSPVINPVHNPPNDTFRIRFEGRSDEVVATGIHRLWKVGQGWVMARDLKAGDTLRAVGGVAKIGSVEPGEKQPVFNLRVADGQSFFVGDLGILAHDNSLVSPADHPFDRAEAKSNDGNR